MLKRLVENDAAERRDDENRTRRNTALATGLWLAGGVGVTIAVWRRARGRFGTATGSRVERKITVERSGSDLYEAWAKLLPRTMEPFATVTSIDAGRAQWTFQTPIRKTYDTLIERTRPGEVISWTTIEPAGAPFSGAVTFSPAPADRGIEVALRCTTPFPDAIVGPALRTALQRFKSLSETGELPTLDRNPSGRRSASSRSQK